MPQIDTDSLRRVAERVETTAREQGVEGQVVVTKTGIRVAASAKKGGSISKREISWDQVGAPDFEQATQEAFNEALKTSREANP